MREIQINRSRRPVGVWCWVFGWEVHLRWRWRQPRIGTSPEIGIAWWIDLGPLRVIGGDGAAPD